MNRGFCFAAFFRQSADLKNFSTFLFPQKKKLLCHSDPALAGEESLNITVNYIKYGILHYVQDDIMCSFCCLLPNELKCI
jgi:hypothetical protein